MHKPDKARAGWGLGLAICRRLVDALEGGITMQSVLGQGSTFAVTIPSRYVVDVSDEHAFHQESQAAPQSHANTAP